MKLRIFVIDPNEAIRDSLAMHIESLGYEVIAAPCPDICPHYHQDFQQCSQENSCGDAIILGQNFPLLNGIDFIERRANGGCKGSVTNNAIICRPWSSDEKRRAEILGCIFFETPIKLGDITDWLSKVESTIPPSRTLHPLPVIS